MKSKLPKNPTLFELFQFEHYGNVLTSKNRLKSEDPENGSQAIQDDAEKVDNHFELELLNLA